MPTHAFLNIPIQVGPTRLHLILLNTVDEERKWPEEYMPRLRLLGEMLVNALERGKASDSARQEAARVAAAGLGFAEWIPDADTPHLDSRLREILDVGEEELPKARSRCPRARTPRADWRWTRFAGGSWPARSRWLDRRDLPLRPLDLHHPDIGFELGEGEVEALAVRRPFGIMRLPRGIVESNERPGLASGSGNRPDPEVLVRPGLAEVDGSTIFRPHGTVPEVGEPARLAAIGRDYLDSIPGAARVVGDKTAIGRPTRCSASIERQLHRGLPG
jgi:hypothetical protein